MSMRDNRVILICLIAAMFAIFSVAHAHAESNMSVNAPTASVPAAPEDSAAAPAPSSNSANVEVNNNSILSHMHANIFATVHGPALNHLDAAETVDQNGKLSKAAMYLDSEAGVTYMFNDKLGVGAVLPFYLYARGDASTIGDAGIKFVNKKTISSSNFNLATNLIIQAPTSTYSTMRKMDISFKTTPNVRYTFQGTRYTVGAWTEAKAYVGAVSGKLFKLYAAPYLNYQLTSKLSLNLEYEMEADHFAKTDALNFQMYQNDLAPGVVWMITPTVMFNPYLQIFTGDKVSSDRMALGALISASI